MKKFKLLFLFLGVIQLSACGNDKKEIASFESKAIIGTWNCSFRNGNATTSSSTTYNVDESFSGFANIRAAITNRNNDAEIKAFAKGTWSIEGNKLIEKIDGYTFKAQNPLGESILSKVQSEIIKIKFSESEIISINKSKMVYKDEDGFISSCSRK